MAEQVNINNVVNPRAMHIDGSSHVVGWLGLTSGNPWLNTQPVFRSTTGGPSAAIPSYGYYDVAASPPSPEYASVELSARVPTPDTVYTFLGYASSPVVADFNVGIAWYDTVENALEHDGFLGADNGVTQSISPNTWTSGRAVGAAPTGAGAMLLQVRLITAPGALVGKRVKFSGLLVAETVGVNAPYSGEYFDGGTAASGITSYEWEGVAHDSNSVQTIQLVAATTPPSVGMLTIIGKA